jgi:DNA topoisomerase-1
VPSVGGVFVPKDPLFEAKHPRDRSGRDRGQFVDVAGVMNGLGAHFDHEQGSWMVPVDRLDDLKQMSKDTGFQMMSVPKGMRPLRSRGALASGTDPLTGEIDPRIAEDAALEKQLAIPPAWTDVMVALDPNAKDLAVGRDEKGRKQRKRNPVATGKASVDKYERIRKLHNVIEAVDTRLTAEAAGDDTAAAAMLIRKMGLRPGSTKDTGAEQFAYGASTLERRHVAIEGDVVHLEFDSKKGGHTVLTHEDAELAAVLRVRLAGKAGDDRLFPKTNDRKMNRWVQETAGSDFTLKDFRTYLATSEAAKMVADSPEPMTAKEHRQLQLKVGARVSEILGNTREEALKSYIDPGVFGAVPGDADADMVAPEAPGQTGRDMLKRAFDAGYVEGDDLAGGVSSDMVRKVTLSDGTIAVLKRPKPEQHRREIIAGVAANALGFDMVHTIDAGEGRVLTEMAHGKPGGKGLPEAELMQHVERPGGREMAVLDWVIRNRDRHGGNWIVNDSGVVPIDHGLTYYGVEGSDRDIPRGVFAKHWLGLTQKPTPWAARGKTNEEALPVRGPKAKLQPKFSKTYLEDVRDSLEAGRDEFTEAEWAGIDARLRILEAAAPDSIPDEKPFAKLQQPKPTLPEPPEAPVPPEVPEPEAVGTLPGGHAIGDPVQYERPGYGDYGRRGTVVGPGQPMKHGEPTVTIVYDDDPFNTRRLIRAANLKKAEPQEWKSLAGVLIDDVGSIKKVEASTPEQIEKVAGLPQSMPKPAQPARPAQPKPAPNARSIPGARHSLPNGMYVSSLNEKHIANADHALKDAGIDLSAAFTRPNAKVGRHAKGSMGLFRPSDGRIDVDHTTPAAVVTALHELGHKLDYEANGPAGRYGSEGPPSSAMGPGWDVHVDVRNAVKQYEAEGWTYVGKRGTWATLTKDGQEMSLNWGGKPFTVETGGAKVDQELDPNATIPGPPFMAIAQQTKAIRDLQTHPKANTKFGKYLQRPREIFARAFSQYVAAQATDPEVARIWQDDQRHSVPELGYGTWPEQWTDQDFATLHEYFDGLMDELGLKIPPEEEQALAA